MDKFDLNNFFNNSFSLFSKITNNFKESIDKVICEVEKRTESSEYYIVDKVVDNFAICEKNNIEEMIKIPIKDISQNIKEGDCLVLDNEKYKINEELTNQRKNMIKEKMDRLFK